jgi:S-adenosylmethionine-diacylglycerol 3-amino-3-carboxypropyl transferase
MYWDRWIAKFFGNPRLPFYYRGTSGSFARLLNLYVDRVLGIRPLVNDLLAAETLDEQRRIYEHELRDRLWTRSLRFAMGRNTTLSLVGVPRAQRQQVERYYDGGIVKFVQDCVEAVFSLLPIADNYFWRVYITGHYTEKCCPEYLKRHNFQQLKEGGVDRISVHSDSIQGFLEKHDANVSRFVLLDHMDWLSSRYFPLLEAEWQAILRRAVPHARVLWRSGGLRTDFVDRVRVTFNGSITQLGELLRYQRELAAELHARDRVHTYGSFYIADLAA